MMQATYRLGGSKWMVFYSRSLIEATLNDIRDLPERGLGMRLSIAYFQPKRGAEYRLGSKDVCMASAKLD